MCTQRTEQNYVLWSMCCCKCSSSSMNTSVGGLVYRRYCCCCFAALLFHCLIFPLLVFPYVCNHFSLSLFCMPFSVISLSVSHFVPLSFTRICSFSPFLSPSLSFFLHSIVHSIPLCLIWFLVCLNNDWQRRWIAFAFRPSIQILIQIRSISTHAMHTRC